MLCLYCRGYQRAPVFLGIHVFCFQHSRSLSFTRLLTSCCASIHVRLCVGPGFTPQRVTDSARIERCGLNRLGCYMNLQLHYFEQSLLCFNHIMVGKQCVGIDKISSRFSRMNFSLSMKSHGNTSCNLWPSPWISTPLLQCGVSHLKKTWTVHQFDILRIVVVCRRSQLRHRS